MKKKNSKLELNIVLGGCCAMMAIAIIIMGIKVAKLSKQSASVEKSETENHEQQLEPTTQPELIVNSMQEQGDTVVVETSYVNVKYSAEFADVINVSVVKKNNCFGLAFVFESDDVRAPLYTIMFNADEGNVVGTLKLNNQTNNVNVSAILYEPMDLNEVYQTTFYAAQETFNDVIVSLEENENYVAVD